MSVRLSAFKISKSHGSQLLFRDLTFAIESGQKIGLIGPNGAGKSTLLRILARQDKADDGQMSFASDLRLGFLEQNPVFSETETVFSALSDATGDPHDIDNLSLVSQLMSRLELDGPAAGVDRLVRELSGGWQKRVALARELARRPDLLLMDEPTNHLDVPSIQWIEDFIASRNDLAILMVTHDRLFLQNTCDLIFDLDRRNPDGLIKFDGSYADFVDFKQSVVDAQKNLETTRRNVLRRETEWLRRGAKARQTKQKARIERAGTLAEEVGDLKERNRLRRVDIDFGDGGRGPKKLIEAVGIGKKDGDRWLFRDFSQVVGSRSRIGLLGANGCGKTTLIKTLLGTLAPDTGTVKIAEGARFAIFEQRKESLKPGVTVLRTLLPEGDYVHVQGKPVYGRSYLSRFHFRPEQLDMPVEKLSGGEQTRLMLARLMLQTEPVLVLDEPTNDLDLETLETLEEALRDFPGAVILVTHDRYFMDQVADEILAFAGDGRIEKFADLFQWEKWRQDEARAARSGRGGTSAAEVRAGGSSGDAVSTIGVNSAGPTTAPRRPVKLSYKEQRELDTMEATILTAETDVTRLQAELISPAVATDFSRLQELTEKLQARQAEVERLYARWSELSEKVGG